MSRCKLCAKRIKWIEVADDKSSTGLRWKAFDPRKSVEPYRAHDCQKAVAPAAPPPADSEKPKPWYLKDD